MTEANPANAGGQDDLEHPDYRTVLLTARQVAERLGISRSHVYVLLGEGQLPSVAIGRSRRVLLGDLARYVSRHREAPPANTVIPPPHTQWGQPRRLET